MHDRHLNAPVTKRPSVLEATSWYKATCAFNTQLRQPLSVDQQASVWAASAILGTMVFCHDDARIPEEAWPLKPASDSDLQWLRMSDGKKQVYALTQALASHQTYAPLTEALPQALLPATCMTLVPRSDSLPVAFSEVYGLNDWCEGSDNPYESAAFRKLLQTS